MSFVSGQILTAAQLNSFDPGTNITNAAGTAAAPSYTFNGDVDTGMFRIGADQIGLATNGVLRATVDSAGVTADIVGDVTGDLTGNVTGNVTGNATTATTATNLSGGSVAATTLTASGDANFDGGTLFVDVSANRVGVRDTTPSYDLDVAGQIRATSNVHANGDLYVGQNGGGDSRVYFYDDNSNAWRVLMWDDSANQFYLDSRVRLNDDLIVDDMLTVGQTSLNTARRLYVYGGSLASEIRRETLSASSGIAVLSGTGGSSRFIFYADGTPAKITGAGDWSGISDDRLKTKLASLDGDDMLARLMALDPTMYERTHTVNLVSDGTGDDDLEIVELDEPDVPLAGFMASAFETQFPDLVLEKGAQGIKHLPIGQWDAILTAGMQAAVRRIETLEARLDELTAA